MFKNNSPLIILDSESAINIFGFLQGATHNRIVNFRPPPPAADMLDYPIFLQQPPRIVLRHRKLSSKVFEALLGRLLSDTQRHQRKLHILIASLMASVWPQTVDDLKKKGWIGRFGQTSWQSARIRHPYHLSSAFDALVSTPKELQTERRALELILAVILREYQKRLSVARGEPFSFEREARRYGLTGYRTERQMRYISGRGEQADTLQNIYNCYYNAANYYQYSLISGEPQSNDGTLFSMYCRSILFNAHVGDNGRISDHIVSSQLPDRERVMFFVLRDGALRRRYNRDQEYAAKIKQLVKMFPRAADA